MSRSRKGKRVMAIGMAAAMSGCATPDYTGTIQGEIEFKKDITEIVELEPLKEGPKGE